jgi:hypothetical protein
MRSAYADRIQAEVKAGRLTQAQANAIEQRINQGKLPFLVGPGREFPGVRRHAPLAAAATYLGLSPAQLFDDLSRGKSLAQIAKEKGKTTDGLQQAMLASVQARLDKAVSAGRITKAQEQTILTRSQKRLSRLVNRTGPLHGGFREGGRLAGPPPGGPAGAGDPGMGPDSVAPGPPPGPPPAA